LTADICGLDDISFLYNAIHIPSTRTVSIKYTDMNISQDFDFIREVTHTVRNTMLCKHPNILPYHITFQENEKIWSVTSPVFGTCRYLLNRLFPGIFLKI
jgi:hypothetical protein